jgi:2OG-Fe(II) oxygenase superfamily
MHTNLQTAAARCFTAPPFSLQKVPEIPPVILNSPLMQHGGFDIFTGIADEFIRKRLLAEALEQRKVMNDCFVTAQDLEEIRGGAPRRKFLSSAGGNFQRAFYHSKWLIDFLRGLTTPLLHPTGDFGTFSHYSRPGDFLEIHRDIVACDVAVITCLENIFGDDETGGNLCLYPERTDELLSEIRAAPETGAHQIKLKEGETIVFYGGIVPHALLPVSENQSRIVSVLCYRAF